MIRIVPLPKPRKELPPLVLKPAKGRTAASRFLRSGAKPKKGKIQ
ncbi:hypothetical protein [uncultured Salipiger sp.]|nr:hypothetical protein [uncultured Salipiger sp.]